MQDKTSDIKNLFKNGHLTDEGIAIWADALIEHRENELPELLKEHVDQCLDCKKEIFELYDDLKEVEKLDKNSVIKPGREIETLSNKGNLKIFYRIAAIIVLLISVAAVIYFTTQTKADHQKLFAEYFKPYPNVITTKGLNEELLSAGMFYYDMEKYDSAIIFYTKMLENNPQNKEVLFYKGICFLAMNKPDEAIESLNKVVSDEMAPYRNSGYWYLALAYLKAGNNQRSKEILSVIAEEESSHSKKAIKLLTQIE